MSVTETDLLRLSRRIKAVEDMPGVGEISLSEVGAITLWPMSAPPDSWLICDGCEVSRTAYEELYGKLCPYKGDAVISIASSALITLNNHGFLNGDSLFITTTGALPSGLSTNTLYYARDVSANALRLSATRGGTAINTSGSQSGTHSVHACPWGISGAATFNLPNLKGKVSVGKDSGDGVFDNLGETGGEKTHTLTAAEIAAHAHSINPPSTGTNETGEHYHSVNPPSTSTSSVSDHNHLYIAPDSETSVQSGSGALRVPGGHTSYSGYNGGHSHTVNIGEFNSGSKGTHAHTVDITQFSSGSSGGSDAHNNLQPYAVLNFIIRYQSYAAPKKGDKGDKGEKGDKGDTGEKAPFVRSQYSADSESWHQDYIEGDYYVRFSVDGGSVWGDAVLIRGPEGQQGIQGEQGIQGVQGEQGFQGIQGEQGIQGTQGETGVSYRMLGEYDAGTPYVNGSMYIDCVTYCGSSYYAKQNTTGNEPTNDLYWGVLALKGLDGQGAGDVVGPVSNTDSKFPQWDGSGTKTLKDGYSLSDIMLAMYPVGAVYISVTGTSPEALFGGTWEAIAPGKVLTGYDAADEDFDTAEATGGEKAHTLLESEMPQHTHGQSSHSHSIAHDHGSVTSGGQSADHTHGVSINTQAGGSHSHHIQWYQGEYISLSGNGAGASSSGYRTGYSSGTVYHDSVLAASAGSHNHLVSGNTGVASTSHTHSVNLPNFSGNSGSSTPVNQNAGGGGQHNNLPPYMVVYMWKRTA